MVSLFIPFLYTELRLSNAAFGAIYSGATLVSALLLMEAGKKVDTEALDRYTIKAELILCASALFLAVTVHPVMLFIALFGLRFAGQGLTSHIGQTVMARHFQKSRGKSLSLASLGYSAGELFLPVILTFSFPLLGWRLSLSAIALLACAGVFILLKVLPVRSFERTVPEDRFDDDRGDTHGKESEPAKFDPRKDRTFWFLIAPGWVYTFAATGYFFYQMMLVNGKGWDPKWYALIFAVYALTRVAAVFTFGYFIDRFGARFLYPLHFAPFIAGCVVMRFSGSAASLAFFMVMMGVTMGAASVLQSAVLAETYGGNVIGTVRSVFASIMIFGAAAGPAAFGLLLDAGITMEKILLGLGILTALAAAASLRTWKRPRTRG